MAKPQQRYRGVRQRHWGSWVSEIRHPLLKTRIWLGTFETAEDAAKSYDEAARFMCGPRARTNFKYSSPAKLLPDTLMAKLQKCHAAASLKPAEKPSRDIQISPGPLEIHHPQFKFKSLEDDHVEQMIQELLDYSSVELCSVMDS